MHELLTRPDPRGGYRSKRRSDDFTETLATRTERLAAETALIQARREEEDAKASLKSNWTIAGSVAAMDARAARVNAEYRLMAVCPTTPHRGR